MQKNPYYAFTLIELLVVISIITIIALGITQVSFNTIGDKQKLETTVTKIVSNIETVRGNALMGKGIGTELNVPEYYQIDFNTAASGSINTQFFSGSLQTYNDIPNTIFGTDFTEISQFRCLNLSGIPVAGEPTSGTSIITITGGIMSLQGDCIEPSSKILELTVKRKEHTETIQINTLNGLIKKD